ncbi:hypothetical protein EST38_g786 [Candolleomyces aberdarensis]|uniref:Uncharacterized protein n=1 Tax=Candolleomyces aberdarensis TaxID=2316362 RepID=A0A4Q2DZ13_9AGAR|nr:hypothetical protein EST38_g786 [Candolleomyces aberdarensis]
MVSPSAPTPPPAIPMTLEPQHHQTETRQGNIPSDNPPAYDCVVEQHSNYPYDKVKPQIPSSLDQSEPLIPYNYGGPAYGRQPTFTPSPTVYYYNNPVTGERITSLLPPTHPEMVCLQAGEHVPQTNYGILGILAAVFWFPLGIGLCLIDKKVKCSRCGITIDEGVCG